jgi:hypothetical protein
MNFEVQRSGIKNRRWGKCTFIGGNTNIYQENKKSNFDFSPSSRDFSFSVKEPFVPSIVLFLFVSFHQFLFSG